MPCLGVEPAHHLKNSASILPSNYETTNRRNTIVIEFNCTAFFLIYAMWMLNDQSIDMSYTSAMCPSFELQTIGWKQRKWAFLLIWWWRWRRASISSLSAKFLRFEQWYDAQRVANDGAIMALKRWNQIWWRWCFHDLLFLDFGRIDPDFF